MKYTLTLLLTSFILAGVANNAQAQVSFGTASSVGVGSIPRSVVVADVNLDGKPDILTASGTSGSVSVRLGNGSGGLIKRHR